MLLHTHTHGGGSVHCVMECTRRRLQTATFPRIHRGLTPLSRVKPFNKVCHPTAKAALVLLPGEITILIPFLIPLQLVSIRCLRFAQDNACHTRVCKHAKKKLREFCIQYFIFLQPQIHNYV